MTAAAGNSAFAALGVGEDLVCILILILRRAPEDDDKTDIVEAVDDEGGGERAIGFDG